MVRFSIVMLVFGWVFSLVNHPNPFQIAVLVFWHLAPGSVASQFRGKHACPSPGQLILSVHHHIEHPLETPPKGVAWIGRQPVDLWLVNFLELKLGKVVTNIKNRLPAANTQRHNERNAANAAWTPFQSGQIMANKLWQTIITQKNTWNIFPKTSNLIYFPRIPQRISRKHPWKNTHLLRSCRTRFAQDSVIWKAQTQILIGILQKSSRNSWENCKLHSLHNT